MTYQIESNPIRTWKTDDGEVHLFYKKEKLSFDFITRYEKIAIEHMKNLPKEAQTAKNLTVEAISLLFKKIYPKIVELKNGDLSLKFVDNCFEGMKISVKLLSRTLSSEYDDEPIEFSETITLVVNPRDTVKEIKEKIQQSVGFLSKNFVLTYQDESLKSDASLVNCEISDGAIIIQGKKGVQEKIKVSFGFDFNQLQEKEEKDFYKKAPPYRIVDRGLNLKGKCVNKECIANQQVVWIQKGMGTFDIGEQAYISICPICKKTAENVNNLGFWDCIYSVQGFQIEEKKKVEIMNQIAIKEKFTTFDESKSLAKWSFLRITTQPRV